MSPAMEKLVSQLATAQRSLIEAKRLLEEYRQGGIAAEQEVVARRNIVHGLADQIKALAGEEGTK